MRIREDDDTASGGIIDDIDILDIRRTVRGEIITDDVDTDNVPGVAGGEVCAERSVVGVTVATGSMTERRRATTDTVILTVAS
jgi:hypothetical protein